ncbi:MAG: MauE/DoxX family redox-associated membrane protein [Fibrobacterota bacterium]
MKALFANPWVHLLSRWIAGGVFIYAAVYKIYDPCDFARAINGYKILPAVFINPLAALLPWMEIFCGILVIQGRFSRGAALLLACMLLTFMTAIGFNLIRGVEFECGCFGAQRDICDAIARSLISVRGEVFNHVRTGCDLVRDALILVPVIFVIFFKSERRVPSVKTGPDR